ncbi:MAG: phosphoribosylglycinamide formyltransferase [Phycisphaerae bacterium]|nr:phosphoribosylglycinamide formyltransferase [Phycisphaerae bacterium]
MSSPVRLGVLISGSGRTMVNFAQRIAAGSLNAVIPIVVSSRADVAGVQRARDLGLEVEVLPRKQFASMEAFSDAITAVLGRYDVGLVAMAGFLSMYRIPPQFHRRVMNIHPALLPRFGGQGMYGHKVHEAVIAAGERESGCTVHFADNEYDHGPIILQRRCPVLPGDTPDTLADRVFEQELIAYPEAVNLFANGRLKVDGGTVTILG